MSYADLVEGVAAVDLDRDVVRVSGPDAIEYLQGQVSQDVAALARGDSAWSLILQPQGKVEAWVRLTRVDDDAVLIDLDRGWGQQVVERLSRFKLRTKANIESLDWTCIALRGPLASAVAGAVRADWPLIGGWDLLGPSVSVPDGCPVASLQDYEVRRIEAGLPRMGAELTESTIPAEAGVVESSVSFTKGCYTGQELVARIDSRGGHVPRRIRGVLLAAGKLPPVGAVVDVDGRVAGTLTSVAAHPAGHGVALASIRRDVDDFASGECGGVAATIRPLPMA